MYSYSPLWCKSNFSFLEGASHPEELVEQAHHLGLRALALTDRDGLYGVVRAHLKARELGLKLLIGAELSVDNGGFPSSGTSMGRRQAPLRREPCLRGEGSTEPPPSSTDPRWQSSGSMLVLIAMDHEGYRNLSRLITKGRLRSAKGSCRVTWAEVCEHAPGLLALWGGERSLLVASADPDLVASRLQKAFGDRLYALLARHRRDVEVAQEQRLRARAARYGIPLVASVEVLYHTPARRPLHDVLTCIHHGVTLATAGTLLKPNDNHALLSAHSLAQLYADDVAAVGRSEELAARCTFNLDQLRYRYPSERLPDGSTSSEWLHRLTQEGAHKRYGDVIPDDVTAQLTRELALIDELDYCGYFLTMWEIVERCRAEGILCQGRGSAANSAVCYCLGITAIDPVRMGLLFERFISRERAEPPDIDLDISHARREEVIQWVYAKYGRARAAMVAVVIRYRTRSAIREVGKVFGLPDDALARLAKLHSHHDGVADEALAQAGLGGEADPLPTPRGNMSPAQPPPPTPPHLDGGEGRRFAAVKRNVALPETTPPLSSSAGEGPGVGSARGDGHATGVAPPNLDLFLSLVRELLDFPRHLSIHPGGFLLGHEPVHDLVPIENGTMADRTVIQWDKDDVEALGLFKIDLLGLGALTHLDHTFKLLRRHRGVELSMATIPPADSATFDMICAANTIGVFQVESRAQMSMLPRLLPRTFYDLVVEVSLVRPGPITGGMVHPYLRRRRGEEEVVYPHPCLEPVLAKTLGVPIFQEQVMKLAVVAADYTPGEADQLRRDMAAWRRAGRIERHRARLVERMQAKGIAAEFAERVFDQIRGFGEYGFPESHAASFALISYATGYLKCHYPAEFYCGLLNAQPMGFYSIATLVEAGKRDGVAFRPVDVLHSDWDSTIEDGAIRMGLRFVKGLRDGEGERIVAARSAVGARCIAPELAPAPTLADFTRRAQLDEDKLSALASCGALEGFGLDRRQALWEVRRLGRERTSSLVAPSTETLPTFAPLDALDTIAWDYAESSHSARGHPLAPLRQPLAAQGLPTARQLNTMRHGAWVRYAGLVICRQRPGTASGVTFMTLEDETGLVNVVIWRKQYERHRLAIRTEHFLGITGKLQVEQNVIHLIAEEVWVPHLEANVTHTQSHDFH